MPITLPLGEFLAETLGLELNNAAYPGSFNPEISFISSNPGVFGFLPQTEANVLPIGIKGAGEANLVVSCDCTFKNPVGGTSITQNKTANLSIIVSGTPDNWTVNITE